MAERHFVGTATAVAQVRTLAVGGTLNGETFTISIGGETIASHTDSTTVIADTVAALVAAWNASTHPYVATDAGGTKGITAADSSPDVVLTAVVAGVPFGDESDSWKVTLNTPGGSATFTQAATTDATGPNFWDEGDNWMTAGSVGTAPASADDVVIADTDVNICWGLAQSAVALTSIETRNYTGRIGLDKMAVATSANGETTDSNKHEYRQDYLDISYTTGDFGLSTGPVVSAGSDRIKIDNAKASGASLTTVHGTARVSADTALPAFRMLVTNSSHGVHVRSARGGVGIAVDEPHETATVSYVYVDDFTSTSKVRLGNGVTITTWIQNGGINLFRAAATVTKIQANGGILTTEGDYTVTTLNNAGGTINANHIKAGGAAVTTANLYGGTTETRGNLAARTWTTVNMNPAAVLNYYQDVLTITTLNNTPGGQQGGVAGT